MSIEKNTDYFGDRSESEKMRNVANMVNDIVNTTPEEPLKVDSEVGEGDGTDEDPKPEEISEDRLCPTCKNNLVFVEGCSICIECGYSGCTSG